MRKLATFKAKYLEDGHLSIPKDVAAFLLLRKGDDVKVAIGAVVSLVTVNESQ